MTAVSIDRLRDGGEALLRELSREHYLTGAGLKSTAALQPIYERHAAVLSEDAFAEVLERFRDSIPGSDGRRSARALLEWLAEERASRELAPLDEREIAWESSAVVRLPDGTEVFYQQAPIDIANLTDREARERLDRARASLVETELAPMRRERLARERESVASLDVADGYLATFEALSGVDLTALAERCAMFLRDTEAMWTEVHGRLVRRELNIKPSDATRADALALFRARRFDAAFPAASLEPAIRRHTGDMGIDLTAGGRIILDTADRESKRPRAFCAPVRIPEEVYLVMRPHGGQTDWTTFLHELGHALHFAYARADLPFEFRWLGDNGITEGYAMLFDHRLLDRGWLLRYTELGPSRVDEFLRAAATEELHFLRRYCAKLQYEVELYRDADWNRLPERYVEMLTGATRFRYRPSDAFVDIDPRFYSTRYLRAWQLQAVLGDALRERFNEDWWRNPRAGPWMVEELFGQGQREMAEEQAERIAGSGLSFAPLVRAIESILS